MIEKLLDKGQRVQFTNAMAELENHGIIEESNFYTLQPDNYDRWFWKIGGTSFNLVQVDKTTYRLEVYQT